MKRSEIAPSEWDSFLDAFSRKHEGWLVTVEEVTGGGGRPRVEAREQPLQHVSVNRHEQSIAIAVGRPPDHLTHTVNGAARLVVAQSDTGADHGLAIEHQDGRSTWIRFRAAVRPDEVDGLPAPGSPLLGDAGG